MYCTKIEIPNVEVSYIIGKHLFDYKIALFICPQGLIILIKTITFKNVSYLSELNGVNYIDLGH